MDKKKYFKVASRLDNNQACNRNDLKEFASYNLPKDIKSGDIGASMWDASTLAVLNVQGKPQYFKNGPKTIIPVITDRRKIISHIWNDILVPDDASVTASSEIDNWADSHTAYPIARAIESHFDDDKFDMEDRLGVRSTGKRATRKDILKVCKQAMGSTKSTVKD